MTRRSVAASRPSVPAGAALRAVSGTLAGGLLALALGMVGAAVLAVRSGMPGPGVGLLVGHAVAAVVAVVAQRRADREHGSLAALAVVVVGAVALTTFWLI